MRALIVILTFLVATSAPDEAPSSQPASAPATGEPASQPAAENARTRQIETLIEQLGDKSYATREAAQKQLEALGDVALPQIVKAMGHTNPEIAQRIALLVRRPADPAIRMQVVTQLITASDPNLVQTGVYMLFEAPIEDYERFHAATESAVGIERAILMPVCEQLKQWRSATEIHLRRQESLEKEKPDAAERERKMHRETYYYQAEAAYWQAIEAAEEYREKLRERELTTKPAAAP